MPELPEVETVKRSLEPVILNQTIVDVDVLYPRILQHCTPQNFKDLLIGNQFSQIKRRGKYLILSLEGDWELIAHLRMTGRLLYVSNSSLPLAKHTSVIFHFDPEGALRFEDVRKFATIDLVKTGDYEQIKGLHTLGVEPLEEDFTLAYFQELLKDRTTKIKGLLLDQSKIAGLGNIYVDESLFMAGVHPERSANSLNLKEQKLLHRSIQDVLQLAIDNQGTTLRDYRTGYGLEGSFQNKLLIYGKKGGQCPNCHGIIEHKKVVGRTSHFCPSCQRE